MGLYQTSLRKKETMAKYYRANRDTILAKRTKVKTTNEQRIYYNRNADPQKIQARNYINNRVASGKIVREPCVDCGESRVEAHHHNGYEQEHWGDVTWLCRDHHSLIHRKYG